MDNENKKFIFMFSLYKLIIIMNIFVCLFGKNIDDLNSYLCVVAITLLVILYWYFVISVLHGNEMILDKIKKSGKVILFGDLLVKLVEYYIVRILSIQNRTIFVFLGIGVLIIDVLLERKIYHMLLEVNKSCTKVIKEELKETYTKVDEKHLLGLYLISIVFIIAGFVQIFQTILGNEVLTLFVIKSIVLMFLLNDYVKTQTKEKKVYIAGINYLVNILILIIEVGIYWILYETESAIYMKAMATAISVVCFEGLLAGQFAKKYNEVKG